MHSRRCLLLLVALAVARHLPAQQAGAFAGGVPSGEAGATPLRLTLADAVARGMDANLGRILADEGAAAAWAGRELERSAVLPHLRASATGSRGKISLDEFGFPVAPGESPLLGPFDVANFCVVFDTGLLDLSGLGISFLTLGQVDSWRGHGQGG